MRKIIKQLIFFYLVFVVIKFLLSLLVPAPSIFSDEYLYTKLARSFFYSANFNVHDIPQNTYPPLFTMLLSLSYIFSNMKIIYIAMKFLNALASSLIIFPAYLLAKEFFSKKKSLFIAILISVIPSNFSFTPYIMAENLFYPLFLFAVYFIYKSFLDKSYKFDLLAGIFIAIASLTKTAGLILIPVVIFVFIFKLYKKEYSEIKKKILMAIVFLILVTPWLIRNSILLGFGPQTLFGNYSREALNVTKNNFFLPFITWFILYLGVLALASGVIFYIMNFNFLFLTKKLKNKNLIIYSLISFLTILITIILGANHNTTIIKSYPSLIPWMTGRPFGRYIDVVLPLILINGFIGFKLFYKKYSKVFLISTLITTFILLIATQLIFFSLFPANNMSLAWIGALKYLFEFIILNKTSFDIIFSWTSLIFFTLLFLFIVGIFLFLHKTKKLNLKSISYFFLIFFFLVSLLSYGITSFNSNKYWYNQEQMQLGLFFNGLNIKGATVLFDERDCTDKISKLNQESICNPGGQTTIIGFWINNDIKTGNVDDSNGIDYIISKHNLDLDLIKETKNKIYLYKVKKE